MQSTKSNGGGISRPARPAATGPKAAAGGGPRRSSSQRSTGSNGGKQRPAGIATGRGGGGSGGSGRGSGDGVVSGSGSGAWAEETLEGEGFQLDGGEDGGGALVGDDNPYLYQDGGEVPEDVGHGGADGGGEAGGAFLQQRGLSVRG